MNAIFPMVAPSSRGSDTRHHVNPGPRDAGATPDPQDAGATPDPQDAGATRNVRLASRYQTSRRTFLRGVGVAMALPWMESIPVWGAAPLQDGVPVPCPKRFAALFMGC